MGQRKEILPEHGRIVALQSKQRRVPVNSERIHGDPEKMSRMGRTEGATRRQRCLRGPRAQSVQIVADAEQRRESAVQAGDGTGAQPLLMLTCRCRNMVKIGAGPELKVPVPTVEYIFSQSHRSQIMTARRAAIADAAT